MIVPKKIQVKVVWTVNHHQGVLNGIMEVIYPEKGTFKINEQELKPYFEENFDKGKMNIILNSP